MGSNKVLRLNQVIFNKSTLKFNYGLNINNSAKIEKANHAYLNDRLNNDEKTRSTKSVSILRH